MPKDLVTAAAMYTFFIESLVEQCEYTTQPKGSFWFHVIDKKGPLLSLIFINKFILDLCLSFLFRFIVELKLLHKVKNVKQHGFRYG